MKMPVKLAAIAVGALAVGGGVFLAEGFARPAEAAEMTVYKSDSCGCCGGWVDHIRRSGIEVNVVATDDLAPVKQRLGVPQSLWSCHTAVIDGKVIEGHVPAAGVKAFLKKPGQARGIGVGGMPTGSPGMEAPGYAPDRYDVMTFGEGAPARFMTFVGADPA
ncbi:MULTISPECIES: DUF411 domain-containing protein [Brevundimonas]|uniref:DUF411 domain-containing protein n=1 Tax=Brevundimonas diminuta TaxID=293 RepID=A0A1Z3LVG9_BREDI|nr:MULTISPECIES: DUF411 domain-containing protein [Brevundimonas]ASD26173.1 hypothetical protein CD943_04280 [Brevundimonas diminuta]OMG59428.1 hypothetical protein BJP32_08990 [Brevundimonas sp. ZS04]